MNKTTLHIVNGDITAEILKKSSLKGEILVWREVLCEGPLQKEFGTDNFWMQRYAFFEEYFKVQKLTYFDSTIKEIVKIEDIELYNEVVLWFEFDLFCQANLLGLCNYLLQTFRKDINYYLICTGKVKGKTQLQALSDFTSKEFEKLYEDKVKITRNNLLYINECWNVFVENNKEKIKAFNFNESSKFQYLQEAMNQHLKRFPAENGLNQIQNKILQLVKETPLTKTELVKQLLHWQQMDTVYGFGDSQYYQYIDALHEFLEVENDVYVLTSKGNRVNLNFK